MSTTSTPNQSPNRLYPDYGDVSRPLLKPGQRVRCIANATGCYYNRKYEIETVDKHAVTVVGNPGYTYSDAIFEPLEETYDNAPPLKGYRAKPKQKKPPHSKRLGDC